MLLNGVRFADISGRRSGDGAHLEATVSVRLLFDGTQSVCGAVKAMLAVLTISWARLVLCVPAPPPATSNQRGGAPHRWRLNGRRVIL
jgi:hypothetical protein